MQHQIALCGVILRILRFKEADLFTIEEYKKENIEINLGE